MPEFEQRHNDALTEQFTQSIRALAELTQSIHSLQVEVEDHSSHILQSKSELLILKDKLAILTRLVQGEGLKDSITSAIIELQTKINILEQWKNESRQDSRERKTTSLSVTIMIVTCISTIIATIIWAAVPMLIQLLTKGH